VSEGIWAVIAIVIVLIVVVTLYRMVRIVPQQRMDIVERLGRYNRTLDPGFHLLVPFFDRVREKVDMREAVQSFPPQPVITSDNLVVSIDTVLYYRVVDPVRAVYEIASFLQAIEQLTVTTLRNVIGSMDLEKALTSRDEINQHLSSVLDETTGRWGIKVTRVEIKAIEPPPSIRDSMEKQMRAERDRRAAILNAEGVKQSQILTADGDRQGAILRAQGEREARILQAEGHPDGVQRRPCGRPGPEGAGVPVPAGASADRQRYGQQDVDHPSRDDQGPRGDRRRAHGAHAWHHGRDGAGGDRRHAAWGHRRGAGRGEGGRRRDREGVDRPAEAHRRRAGLARVVAGQPEPGRTTALALQLTKATISQ
jgi:regulator of protease activity HflC (stomatin/prohibitin superfamily)